MDFLSVQPCIRYVIFAMWLSPGGDLRVYVWVAEPGGFSLVFSKLPPTGTELLIHLLCPYKDGFDTFCPEIQFVLLSVELLSAHLTFLQVFSVQSLTLNQAEDFGS